MHLLFMVKFLTHAIFAQIEHIIFSLAKFPRKSWAGPVPLCPYLLVLAWTYSFGLDTMSWYLIFG